MKVSKRSVYRLLEQLGTRDGFGEEYKSRKRSRIQNYELKQYEVLDTICYFYQLLGWDFEHWLGRVYDPGYWGIWDFGKEFRHPNVPGEVVKGKLYTENLRGYLIWGIRPNSPHLLKNRKPGEEWPGLPCPDDELDLLCNPKIAQEIAKTPGFSVLLWEIVWHLHEEYYCLTAFNVPDHYTVELAERIVLISWLHRHWEGNPYSDEYGWLLNTSKKLKEVILAGYGHKRLQSDLWRGSTPVFRETIRRLDRKLHASINRQIRDYFGRKIRSGD